MSRNHVTFEVDTAALFDAVAKVGDNGAALGARLVEALLVSDHPTASVLNAVGLGVYGVAHVESVPIPTPAGPRLPIQNTSDGRAFIAVRASDRRIAFYEAAKASQPGRDPELGAFLCAVLPQAIIDQEKWVVERGLKLPLMPSDWWIDSSQMRKVVAFIKAGAQGNGRVR